MLVELRYPLQYPQYGRASLVSLSSENGPSLSMPFFDGFGIFRNTYRYLKGFYLTPASLPYAEHRREKNMFTLTLGPHGATMPDIVKSLESELQVFEKGVRMARQQQYVPPYHTMQRLGVEVVIAQPTKEGIYNTM